jgi:hypothetical protein
VHRSWYCRKCRPKILAYVALAVACARPVAPNPPQVARPEGSQAVTTTSLGDERSTDVITLSEANHFHRKLKALCECLPSFSAHYAGPLSRPSAIGGFVQNEPEESFSRWEIVMEESRHLPVIMFYIKVTPSERGSWVKKVQIRGRNLYIYVDGLKDGRSVDDPIVELSRSRGFEQLTPRMLFSHFDDR